MHSEERPATSPTAGTSVGPLISDLADDADMIDLVEEFVGTLPGRVEAIQAAWAQSDLDTLTSLAHQLKGAGGGFGFSPITDAACQLELAAREELAPATLTGLVDELVATCRRARTTPG